MGKGLDLNLSNALDILPNGSLQGGSFVALF